MATLPDNNQFQYQQTYTPALFLQGRAAIVGVLAAPTGSYVYQAGSLMALYTGGGSVGEYVNYVDGEANGQGTCVGILDDYNLSYDQLTDGGGMATIQVGGDATVTFVSNASLDVLTPGDIITGMADLNARYYPDNGAGVAVWYLP